MNTPCHTAASVSRIQKSAPDSRMIAHCHSRAARPLRGAVAAGMAELLVGVVLVVILSSD